MDDRLHRGRKLSLGRRRDLSVGGLHRPFDRGAQQLDGLITDLHGLAQLGDAHQIARVAVAAGLGDELEVEALVARVGIGLANVVRDPGGSEQRTADTIHCFPTPMVM